MLYLPHKHINRRVEPESTRKGNRVKILLVEDGADNVQSARSQLEPLGHTLLVRTTLEDVCPLDFKECDAVLTDMNIARGGNRQAGPTLDQVPKDAILPGGLIVVLGALAANTPVALVTDSNGHHDVLGMLLGRLIPGDIGLKWDEQRDPDMKGKYITFLHVTEPKWIKLPNGRRGKDWLYGFNQLTSKKEFEQGFPDIK